MSNTQFLTCVFKIHDPSLHKKMVMDNALEEYTVAYQRLLDYAIDNIERIERDGTFKSFSRKTGELLSEKYTGKSIASLLPRIDIQAHSSIKDSLMQDVAGNLASYFELKNSDDRTSFPQSRNLYTEVADNALDNFVKCGASLEDYNSSKDEYLRVNRVSYMPVYFARPDGATKNRNFSLLMDTESERWFAVLYLLPANHKLGKSVDARRGNLIRIDTGDIFTSKSKCAILVPIQVGRNGWQQHKFLEAAKNGYAKVKTAYLVKDSQEYFLHIAFQFECDDEYKPEAYLGIDMGILYTAAYGIVDTQGKVLDMSHFNDDLRELQQKYGRIREYKARNGKKVTKIDYRTQEYNKILHVIANRLIATAIEYKAQIVIEELNIQVRGKRVISRFRKLKSILEYKCKLRGVPFKEIFAAYTSLTCHKCGGKMSRDDRLVVCTECGYTGHSDDNAGVNIARRAMYRKKDWLDKGGYKAFHKSFANI